MLLYVDIAFQVCFLLFKCDIDFIIKLTEFGVHPSFNISGLSYSEIFKIVHISYIHDIYKLQTSWSNRISHNFLITPGYHVVGAHIPGLLSLLLVHVSDILYLIDLGLQLANIRPGPGLLVLHLLLPFAPAHTHSTLHIHSAIFVVCLIQICFQLFQKFFIWLEHLGIAVATDINTLIEFGV